MDDLISRQQAIEAINKTYEDIVKGVDRHSTVHGLISAVTGIYKNTICLLPSAQPYTIHSDGRLWVTVDDIDKVSAVVVDENKSMFCKQFYMDAQPEIVRCKDCKYWNSGSCEYREHAVNCQDYMVGDIETEAEHFCGYAERREVKE